MKILAIEMEERKILPGDEKSCISHGEFIGVISKVIKSNERHLKSNKECTFVKLFVSFFLTFC